MIQPWGNSLAKRFAPKLLITEDTALHSHAPGAFLGKPARVLHCSFVNERHYERTDVASAEEEKKENRETEGKAKGQNEDENDRRSQRWEEKQEMTEN